MNRLANALAFAVVVLGMFVMEARSAWPQYSPSRLVACFAQRLHTPQNVGSNDLPTVASLEGLPQIDEVKIDRAMSRLDEARMQRTMVRMQAAREKMVKAEMRIAAAQVNAKLQRARCTVVKLDQ